MGFFNRFRKKDEQTGGAPAAAGQGEPVSKNPYASAREAGAQPEPPGETHETASASQVKEVSAEELKARMDAGTAPMLIDVREEWEHQIANIGTAILIPMNSIPTRMAELDKDAEIIVYCHHGQRSWNVAAYMMQHGFTNVKNLTGGIDSWARRVDRTVRTY